LTSGCGVAFARAEMALLADNQLRKSENVQDGRENGLFHTGSPSVKAVFGEFCKSVTDF